MNVAKPDLSEYLFQHGGDKALMPSELQQMMEKFVSGSKTGTRGKCQGGDAMLEEILTKNVWRTKQWLKVFRNMDKFSQVIKIFEISFKNNKNVQIKK
jgi:hypothetical protein